MPADRGTGTETGTFVVTDLTPGDPPASGPPPLEPDDAAPTGPERHRPRRRLRSLGSYAVLTVFAIIVLFPIYVTIVNSLLPPDQLVRQPPPLFTTHPHSS